MKKYSMKTTVGIFVVSEGFLPYFTPAAESHGLWPWMNAPALGRDVAPLGRSLGATGFARGAPQ
jgi:hypothetical protein